MGGSVSHSAIVTLTVKMRQAIDKLKTSNSNVTVTSIIKSSLITLFIVNHVKSVDVIKRIADVIGLLDKLDGDLGQPLMVFALISALRELMIKDERFTEASKLLYADELARHIEEYIRYGSGNLELILQLASDAGSIVSMRINDERGSNNTHVDASIRKSSSNDGDLSRDVVICAWTNSCSDDANT